jgi:hypothetical protein
VFKPKNSNKTVDTRVNLFSECIDSSSESRLQLFHLKSLDTDIQFAVNLTSHPTQNKLCRRNLTYKALKLNTQSLFLSLVYCVHDRSKFQELLVCSFNKSHETLQFQSVIFSFICTIQGYTTRKSMPRGYDGLWSGQWITFPNFVDVIVEMWTSCHVTAHSASTIYGWRYLYRLWPISKTTTN